MIDANPRCDEAAGLRRALVANSLIVGRDFAELDDWLTAVREDLASEPSLEDLSEDDDPWREKEDGEDWDDDPQPVRDLKPMLEAPSAPIINRGAKVRRNDPCPCGSGMKFKKCCLKKR